MDTQESHNSISLEPDQSRERKGHHVNRPTSLDEVRSRRQGGESCSSPSSESSSLVDMVRSALHSPDSTTGVPDPDGASFSAAPTEKKRRNDPSIRVSLNYSNSRDQGAIETQASLPSSITYSPEKSVKLSPSIESDTVADEEHGVTRNDVLVRNTDPFAVREGSTLTWRSVNMTLLGTRKMPEKKLLDNVWGEVPRKQTTAILGASGAGKTSLLNVLAGRLQSNNKLRIEADVRLDNYRIDPTDINARQNIAFVAQDDSLQITSTPREAIRFSAKMRLRRDTTDEQLDTLTTRMLVELGLERCADTLIGGALIKGISGGERKRTSVGVELVVRPSVVFCDEPTSGLDSFSAEQCCEVLKKVADAGASVLFTIHQPASEVFSTFDHIILLNAGRVMYQGPTKAIPKFFAARGFPIPHSYNHADWIIDVAQGISLEELAEAGFFVEKHDGASTPTSSGENPLLRASRVDFNDIEPPSTLTQIRMLFYRELLHIRRDWTVVFGRVFLVAFLALFIGLIFYEVGSADKNNRMTVTSQFGVMITILIAAMMSTSQIALFSFPDERPVFLREYSTKHYSVVSYFAAHLTTEFLVTAVQTLILVLIVYHLADLNGSIVVYFLATYALAMTTTAQAVFGSCLAGSNTKLAMQLLPLLFTPQMLFSGFFVAPELIPVWLQWAPYVCAMTYSTRIVVVEEFHQCSSDPAELVNCGDVLESTGSNPDDVWWYWLVLFALFVAFRLGALFVLQKSALKFY